MNIFRLAGDLSHVLAIIILLIKIWKTKSCAGISGRSQVLFALTYTTRYLDLFIKFISEYNYAMKIFFIGTSYATLYLIYLKFKATYDRNHDTFRIEFLVIPVVILSLLVNHDFSPLEILWTFSIYLESVAIVPQLFMILKTGEAETIISLYLFCLGSYRGLYILNWVYRYYSEGFYDLIAIISGIVQTILYCVYFCVYYFKKKTVNATQVNVITGKDDKVAFDAVEQVKLVGFFIQGTADYLAFEKAASHLSPSVAFYVTFDRTVAKYLNLSTVGEINLVKPFTKTPLPCLQNLKSSWLDTSTLNSTGDKNSDVQILQIPQDFLTGVVTNTLTPVKIGTQSFVQTPTPQTVVEGSDIFVECVVENQVGDCLWPKGGHNIGFNLNRHPHYSWRGDNTFGDYSLLSKGVLASRDSRECVCDVTGDQDNMTVNSTQVTVLVMETPQPHFLSSATLVEANVGESVSFRCDVVNLGDFVLLWKKNNYVLSAGGYRLTKLHSHIQIDGSSLLINSVQPEDNAEYTCQISTIPPIELTHTLRVLSVNPKGVKGEL